MTNHHQQQSNSDAIRPPPVHGGRFDFDDGGTYCGGWEDGKAHGFGVCTGPKGLGEFSGFWQFGYEVSGVYLWPSGNRYEGQWMSGKRHGLGVEKKGRWIYKGEWTQGFKGRYGVRISERSGARFEGTWANGLQDGYGVETYGDGGTYFGQISQGLRSGYGVRRSVPYGVAARYKLKHFSDSLTSLRSANALVSGRNAGEELFRSARKSEENRGGFVLRDRFSCDEVPVVAAAAAPSKSSLRRTIMAKLRKQKSAGDAPEKKALNPFRSNTSTASYESKHSSRTVPAAFDEDRISAGFDQAAGSDGSDEAALMTTDPNIIESYMGEWKADKRTGFGIAERSDGLRYEGEWLNNKKNGYGITTNRDGSREEGKYKNNVLVSNKHRFGRILSLRLSKIHERAEFAASSAMSAAQSAQQKAEIAASRANNARAKAQAAEVSAKQARHESQTARHRAEEIAPDFKQPGIIHLDNTIPLDIDAQGDGGHLVVVNHVVQHPSPQVISHFADGIRDSQIIRQSAPIGFHQPTTFISPDFPMPLNQQRYVSPIFRSRQPPPQNCWRPASSNYGFSIGHHQPMRDSVEIRPHRFSINSSNLQWQQQRHPPPSVCQHLVVPADLQEAISDQDEPITPEKPAESPKSDFIQPPPTPPPPTKIRRPPHNQKSVDMATLRIRRNTDEPESIPRLRRRKSLPSIVHLASSIAGGRYSADNSTVSMLFANNNKFSSPPNSSGREKTFVIENGIKKRIREVRFAGHIIETPPPPPLIQPRGEAIAKSSSDDLDTVKKLPLQWSIVDDSPRLPRRIVLETIDSSLRRSIPDNIDTAHVKGLSREEVCALSSKRRQELRDERRLRENPLLWLVVCALSYIRRHRLTASLIAVIDVILFLWWLFHSQGRSRPHGSGNGGGSGQPATT